MPFELQRRPSWVVILSGAGRHRAQGSATYIPGRRSEESLRSVASGAQVQRFFAPAVRDEWPLSNHCGAASAQNDRIWMLCHYLNSIGPNASVTFSDPRSSRRLGTFIEK